MPTAPPVLGPLTRATGAPTAQAAPAVAQVTATAEALQGGGITAHDLQSVMDQSMSRLDERPIHINVSLPVDGEKLAEVQVQARRRARALAFEGG
jgi:hypothetical protein